MGELAEGLVLAAVTYVTLVVLAPHIQRAIGLSMSITILTLACLSGTLIALHTQGWPHDWRLGVTLLAFGIPTVCLGLIKSENSSKPIPVQLLSTKQLQDRAMNFAKTLRTFDADQGRAEHRLNSERVRMMDRRMDDAKRQELWSECNQKLFELMADSEHRFKIKYLGEAIALRNELIDRVPHNSIQGYPANKRANQLFDYGGVNRHFVAEAASYIEYLAANLRL